MNRCTLYLQLIRVVNGSHVVHPLYGGGAQGDTNNIKRNKFSGLFPHGNFYTNVCRNERGRKGNYFELASRLELDVHERLGKRLETVDVPLTFEGGDGPLFLDVSITTLGKTIISADAKQFN